MPLFVSLSRRIPVLGELLGRLHQTGLEDRTAVVAGSDHGDYCGDYGLTEKWWIGLEDSLTRVQREDPTLLGKSAMVRTHRWKYIRRTCDPDELYDLQADPQELTSLAGRPEHAGTLCAMRDRLLAWYVETCDVVPLQHDPRDLPEFANKGK